VIGASNEAFPVVISHKHNLITRVTTACRIVLSLPGTGLQSISMAQCDPDSFKEKLVGQTVIIKVSLFSRPFRGAISATDDTGFCFVSEEMIAALRETTGSIMADMHTPSVYLPFSKLEWLVSSESEAAKPKAAAAHA
jgi:hypothetical protein